MPSPRPTLLDRSLTAERESKSVDFKRGFNSENGGDWCEIVKDLVAMANSGGGVILIGVEDDGSPAPHDSASTFLQLDPATIADKVAKYTGVQFDGFEVAEAVRNGQAVAILSIEASLKPLIFEKPGTYPIEDRKQKTAFGAGTLYVRHGAKSEPATSADLSRIIERSIQSHRREWMAGVRRVVNTSTRPVVSVLPAPVRQSDDPAATAIRITTDSSAPEYRLVDPDATHPFRQKELIAEVNALLPRDKHVNQFDILAVRQAFRIDQEARYFHKARYATAQYSPEFRDWLVEQVSADPSFFRKAREEYSRHRVG